MRSFLHAQLSKPLSARSRGGVLAIGNFDGVHLGHQTVLAKAKQLAQDAGVPCYALSFEPHPRTLIQPESPVFRLTPETMKGRVLFAFGADGLLTLPFTRQLATTTADDFVTAVLNEAAGASHVVTGFNFHFGKDRQGSPEFLRLAGAKHGFGVSIMDAKSTSDEDAISSSRIRRQLGAADVEAAADLLGYRWTVSGEVVKGAQLGRTLGYPTANLVLPESCHLAHGIYAVRFRRADGRLYNGVASYGRRPTFDNGPAWLETFIFDFNDDLYEEEVEVSLFKHLRGEEKFDSAEALVLQMDKDAVAAKNALKEAEPLSALDKKMTFDGLV